MFTVLEVPVQLTASLILAPGVEIFPFILIVLDIQVILTALAPEPPPTFEPVIFELMLIVIPVPDKERQWLLRVDEPAFILPAVIVLDVEQAKLPPPAIVLPLALLVKLFTVIS
jgi:hypothetical protein